MIDPKALSRMGLGAVNNAIASVEMDMRALEREVRVFDLTPKKERTERLVININQVDAVHQRLTETLKELKKLSQCLSAPLPAVHQGQDPTCRTCAVVRIVNEITP